MSFIFDSIKSKYCNSTTFSTLISSVQHQHNQRELRPINLQLILLHWRSRLRSLMYRVAAMFPLSAVPTGWGRLR